MNLNLDDAEMKRLIKALETVGDPMVKRIKKLFELYKGKSTVSKPKSYRESYVEYDSKWGDRYNK